MGLIRIHHEGQFHNEMAKIPSNRLAVLIFERPEWTGLKDIEGPKGLIVKHPFTTFFFIPTNIASLITEYQVPVNDICLPYFKFMKDGSDVFCVKNPKRDLVDGYIRKFDPTYKKKSKPAPEIVPEPYDFNQGKIEPRFKKIAMRRKLPADYKIPTATPASSGSGDPEATSQWKELYDKKRSEKSQDEDSGKQIQVCAGNGKVTEASCETVGDTTVGLSLACRVKVKLPDKTWRIYEVNSDSPISAIREMMLVDCPNLAFTKFQLLSFVTPPYRVLDESVSIEDGGCVNARIQAKLAKTISR